MTISGRARHPRRSSDGVRELLLDAARTEYMEKGYTGASNRDVVKRAGVTLSVMHRHFPTKSDLFAEAVLEPFVRGFEQNADDWLTQVDEPLSDEQLMRLFVRDIYVNILEHRHVLQPLANGPGDLHDAVAAHLKSVMDKLFRQLRLMTELEARRRGWFSPEGVDMMSRVLIGMVMGIAAYGWLLLPEGDDQTGTDLVIDNMVKVGLWGLARHAPDGTD
jgi:AcrR family transcriptional regulator